MLKRQTRENYNDRLNRVLDYVHAHLEDDVSFDRLAEVACLSPYHWSRIYSAMRGETIAATIRRLRLQRAADRLANTDSEIGVVAARAGYSSTDTFGRAFKDAFGASPAAYREKGSHAAFKAANAASDAGGFPVTVETLPQRRCAGIDHAGSYMEIDHAMGRLFAELAARQALPAEPAMIGVFFDDPDLGPEEELRSRACLPAADSVAIDAPLVETVLRGGPYAKLSYTGPYADMRGAYRWFLGVWLPASGCEPDDAPIFEAYLNDPRDVPQTELRTDIHLPLKVAP
jgi:AraC family transcriptional regulator